jgi:DASH complex subunit SPC19
LSEIKPEVDSLLNRVSTYLDKLERREQSLIAKCDLQEGRLSQGGSSSRHSRARSGSGAHGKPSVAATALEELKMKQMRQKKDRLSYAVDRLTLQAQQKERQLRLSMAAQ